MHLDGLFVKISKHNFLFLHHTVKNNSNTNYKPTVISMSFNIAQIRSNVGGNLLLTRAELRMLIKEPMILSEERVELYYSQGTSTRYHASRFVTNMLKDKWLSFDVTEPLRTWLQGNGEISIYFYFIIMYLSIFPFI